MEGRKSQTAMPRVTDVNPMRGEHVTIEGLGWVSEFERYDPDNWRYWAGESTETLFDCAQVEAAYQVWKNRERETPKSDPQTAVERIEARINEQITQHEEIYMHGASDLDRNRLWRLRDTMVRIVREEIVINAE